MFLVLGKELDVVGQGRCVKKERNGTQKSLADTPLAKITLNNPTLLMGVGYR
ncbi:hypothetical protein AJ85_04630 [Alkalihalobacillus alcalophilus ATCC 27647 = CGMCC 1.3604]|uniref:Uncharacterized protein n=1 Tax=Alkalihalobacillus alcalophilus ATCC 27647 = CGMCC 1.3604 TaxID=1218173 RepID=A0A4S4K1M8_ALKAL|nr:hypothetical protein AJ85_04630 [Alkalihalobacillus alcalophilus ATCC 27647 = CGMCC 1.3604]